MLGRSRTKAIALLFITLVFSQKTMGAGFQSGEVRFDINAYFDLDVNYMSKMAMAMPCTATAACTMGGMSLTSGHMLMPMKESYAFDQNHLNIVLSGSTQNFRGRINLESRHAYSSFDTNTGSSGNPGTGGQSGTQGAFRIAEVYGDIGLSTKVQVRAGQFYTPFGLFNQTRYITPLYATVVLPFLYELPRNYNDTPIFPSNSNLMVYGDLYPAKELEARYYVYASMGTRNLNSFSAADAGIGGEANSDKGFGGRVRLKWKDRYSLGVSYFTVLGDDNNPLTIGTDIEIQLPASLKFQGEYAFIASKGHTQKNAYYARLVYEGFEKVSPYVMWDAFRDHHHPLYDTTQNRIGVGVQWSVATYVTTKIEYHNHFFTDIPTATGTTGMGVPMVSQGPKTNHMIRLSTIFLL